MSKLIFITGVSTGLGRAFAAEALNAGHRVVGTLRSEQQRLEFEALAPGRSFGRLLDVTDTHAIPTLVTDIEETIGAIDVLVNNAGYGVEGTLEESPLEELYQQFAVNVFGVVAVTKAVLPHLRQRRSGHIVFITSMGGLRAFPGLAYYHGSKFAVEGIAATLRQEVAGFGIHVTAVEPGGFRTNWAGSSMRRVDRTIPDYDELMDPIRKGRQARSGTQLGDPAKAGQALLTLIASSTPPGHLMLGSDALQLVTASRSEMDDEIQAWKDVTLSTDHAMGQMLS